MAKLDFDLNPVWARAYSGEAFEYARSSLNFLPDGKMVLGYSTFGAFPTVLAKLDTDGQIINQQGYALYEPKLDVMPDGSLIMVTNKYFDSTKLVEKRIIARTDPDGNIDGCETFPSCLVDGPVSVEFGGDFTFKEGQDSVPLDSKPVTIDSFELNFEVFCQIPAPPAPDFFLPDTVCMGDTVRTTGTKNILADAREWAVSKNGQEKTVRDSLNIGIRFSEAGNWKVAQKVWFLGCEYEFQRIVVVLPPLGLAILAEPEVACSPPVVLSAKANRALTGLLWGNGSTSPAIEVLSSGNYKLTATDGFCVEKDSVEINFISEKIGNQVAFQGSEMPFLYCNSISGTYSDFQISNAFSKELR